MQSSLLLDGNITKDTILNRLNNVYDNGDELSSREHNEPLKTSAWGQIYDTTAHWSGGSDVLSMNRSLTGFITGFDAITPDNWQLGLFAGSMHSLINSGTSTANIDSYQLGAYGGHNRDNFKLSFGVSGSIHEITSNRIFNFKDISTSNQADYMGKSLLAFTDLGYTVHTPLARITPFAGLSYTKVKTDAFVENPTVTSLSGNRSSTEAWSTQLGVRVGQNYALSDSVTLGLNLTAAWQHNIQKLPFAYLNFSGGDSFKINGLSLQRDAFIFKSGLQLDLKHNTSIAVYYEGQQGNKMKDNSVKADFTIRF